jgi:hypothetical protein
MKKLFYQVDIAQAEINNRIIVCITFKTDFTDFFPQKKNLDTA